MAKKAGGRGQGKRTSHEDDPGERFLPLAAELEVFRADLPGGLDREGQHVLVRGQEVAGFFPTREEALMAGCTRFGMVPFLVKPVAPAEPVHDLGHVEL